MESAKVHLFKTQKNLITLLNCLGSRFYRTEIGEPLVASLGTLESKIRVTATYFPNALVFGVSCGVWFGYANHWLKSYEHYCCLDTA